MSPDRRPEYNLHPEGLTPNQETLLVKVFEMGAIRIEPTSWKMHKDFPDAPPAPMYSDFRMLRRDPNVKKVAVDVYVDILKGLDYDLLADAPTAITPIVASLSDTLSIGQITPRLDKKDYGPGQKIDGLLSEDVGKTAVLVDDLVNFGSSKREAIEILEAEGIGVSDIVVLLDYGFLEANILNSGDGERSYEVHSAFSVEQMLEFYLRRGKITIDQYKVARTGIEELRSYVRSHPQVGSV